MSHGLLVRRFLRVVICEASAAAISKRQAAAWNREIASLRLAMTEFRAECLKPTANRPQKEVTAMDQLLGYAANYGFPMMISVYLLVRIEGKLEQLAASINELSKVIAEKL
ncbi:MAG: YvrJ family protein [Veillonellales bacterium]